MAALGVVFVGHAAAWIASRVCETNGPPSDIRAITPMKSRNILFASLAWFQLAISLLLAAAIIWGYVTFQASIGQFVSSLSASIGAVSTVVVRTAETVEARQEMLDETQKVLVETRNLITEIKAMTEKHAKLGPQYAAGMKATSNFLGKVAGPLQTIGEKMIGMSVPNIQIVGIKPVVTMTKPLEEQGKQLKEVAQDFKTVRVTLVGISDSIDQDGQKVGTAFIATSDQAIKVIGETEKTLARLKTQDLPKAIADLKATSENLRSISAQVDTVSNVGLVMLVVGLLLALWCIVHSLGSLLLVRSHAFGPDADKATAITNARF